ncbi:MAG: GNAT family N-acetyltransferase, partial [Candidatus Pacearchaeota archaeon]|nr:GNAT family N-acetyltransferase [Candidatus Pacearchaeota archaeon]
MLRIKKLSKEEIDEIARNYEQIMKKFFAQVREKPITAREYALLLRKSYKKSFMLVLTSKKILGFAWITKKGKEWTLEEIFVTEMRKGYGTKLMKFLLREARKKKVKKINLNVHVKNKKAIKFFKKLFISYFIINTSQNKLFYLFFIFFSKRFFIKFHQILYIHIFKI